MADLFAPSKIYKPRRTILSADMNNELAALVAALNTLGSAPATGRFGVSTAFSVADATEAYHAINKAQFDAAITGVNTVFVPDSDYTLTDGTPVDIQMAGRTANRTVTLCQNPANGQICRIRDTDYAAATWLITIARNTRLVNGAADDLTINLNGAVVTLAYDLPNTNWVIIDVSSRKIS